jgi:hypothetical protein
MKFKIFRITGLAAFLALTACNRNEPPLSKAEQEAEIERQVEARLREERLAELEKQLAERELALNDRQTLLAEKERLLEEERKKLAAESTTPSESGGTATSKKPEPAAQSVATGGYDTFYEDLSPYGSWYDTNDYGYVFQPRIALNSGWQPYEDGEWVYTDNGWTFVTNEPFGWATYHYGRWTSLRDVGWVWVPGNEWGPAWVSWRTNENYVGWAPLPPGSRFGNNSAITASVEIDHDIGPAFYIFVPINEFCDRSVRRYRLPANRNIPLVQQTRNVTYIVRNKSVVINNGPDYDLIRKRSERDIRRLRINRERLQENRAERMRITGDQLLIAAPRIEESRGKTKPAHVAGRVSRVSVERGWSSVENGEEAENLRRNIREQQMRAAKKAERRAELQPEQVDISRRQAVEQRSQQLELQNATAEEEQRKQRAEQVRREREAALQRQQAVEEREKNRQNAAAEEEQRKQRAERARREREAALQQRQPAVQEQRMRQAERQPGAEIKQQKTIVEREQRKEKVEKHHGEQGAELKKSSEKKRQEVIARQKQNQQKPQAEKTHRMEEAAQKHSHGGSSKPDGQKRISGDSDGGSKHSHSDEGKKKDKDKKKDKKDKKDDDD